MYICKINIKLFFDSYYLLFNLKNKLSKCFVIKITLSVQKKISILKFYNILHLLIIIINNYFYIIK